MDRRLKNRSVHNQLGKRVVDQNWADYKEESNEEEYVWQEGQWCPGGLTRSQKKSATPKEQRARTSSGIWKTSSVVC